MLTRAPRRRRLPPGRAGLRRRLTPLAAPGSPGPYYAYCPLRPGTASDARGTRRPERLTKHASCSSPLNDGQRRLGDEDGTRPHERGHLELRRHRDQHARQVAERLDQRLLLLARHDDERHVLPPRLDEVLRRLRRGSVESPAVED